MPTPTTKQQHDYLVKRRQRALVYLGGKCQRCGTGQNLEFDHIDPATKELDISTAIARHWSWARLVSELDKCQLLCRPHHLEKSRSEGNYKGGQNKILNPPHGTWAKHVRDGCTCDLCVDWRKKYRKGLVDARGNLRE